MKNIILILMVLGVAGCSVSKKSLVSDEYSKADSKNKIIAEAFLYDAKFYENKKPRSFRLQVYRTDSIIAFTGKGYFGKGVLRGTLTSDSLKVYFPTQDEYYYKAVEQIFKHSECDITDADFDLATLFDFNKTEEIGSSIYQISETKKKRKKIIVNQENCSWDIEIEYKNYNSDLRPYLFSYTNQTNQKITAKLRKFKKSAKVKANLFKMPILK